LGNINDLGVAVGMGDVPPLGLDGVGATHLLAVNVLGSHSGEWTDLGSLGGTNYGWEEPLVQISNTGIVVGHSPTASGYVHGALWTAKTGIVDLGTLADLGFSPYNSSYAASINKFGTVIVGWSGVEQSCLLCAPTIPVAWTRSVTWKNGVLATSWEIHALDTTGFDEMTYWYAWNVNDFGQIVGEGSNAAGDFVGVLWTPIRGGWKLAKLPVAEGLPISEPFNINDRGEITGNLEPSDASVWLPAYWKPLNLLRTTYSPPIVLGMPEGFSSGYADGINEIGDMTGELWGEAGDQAFRWSTRRPAFSELIGIGDWSWSFGVNNSRIAVVTYGGLNCKSGSCGGAIQLR
jgi:probable HAF family extracellular repeat protein